MKSFSKLRKSKSQGFSVVEVIVATLVFTIAAAGIFAMTTGLQKPAIENNADVNAALTGKRILENLRTKVDASAWSQVGGQLDPSTNPHVLPTVTVDGITYTPSYNVLQEPDGGRRVTLGISW